MKFSDKYPEVGSHTITEENMKLSDDLSVSPCLVCGEATNWIEADFLVPICSEECLDLQSIKWVNELYKGKV